MNELQKKIYDFFKLKSRSMFGSQDYIFSLLENKDIQNNKILFNLLIMEKQFSLAEIFGKSVNIMKLKEVNSYFISSENYGDDFLFNFSLGFLLYLLKIDSITCSIFDHISIKIFSKQDKDFLRVMLSFGMNNFSMEKYSKRTGIDARHFYNFFEIFTENKLSEKRYSLRNIKLPFDTLSNIENFLSF